MSRLIAGRGLTGRALFLPRGVSATAPYLAITTTPSSTPTSGEAFAQQPVIQLKEGNGANRAASGVTVTAALASGTGSLSGDTTKDTDANGTATFTDLAITGTGAHTIQFTATGYTSITSGTLTVGDGSLLFESSWDTATGTTEAAVTDNGKFSWGSESDPDQGDWGSVGNELSVVASSSITDGDTFPGSTNVLARARTNNYGHCVAINDTTGPYFPMPDTGQFWGVRYYFMNSTAQVDEEQHANCFWPIGSIVAAHLNFYAGTGGNYHIETGWATPVPSSGIWGSWGPMASAPTWGTPFSGGAWYRYEFILEWLSGYQFRVHPRLYNMSDVLLYDADDWYDAFGSYTIATHQAGGGYFQIANTDEVRHHMRYISWGGGQARTNDGHIYTAKIGFGLRSSATDFIGA